MSTKNEINEISFTQNIKDTYARYLFTTHMIADSEPELRKAFISKLNKDFSISQGPYHHCTPCYKPSFSIKELVENKGPVALSPLILKLPKEYFDPDRSLYSHQVKSIKHLKDDNNLVVATGTGSGKTECFLLPILDSILSNPSAGLRVIIIYPMNALADDQLIRLRNLLKDLPEVTFGRYTGDTPWNVGNNVGEDRLPNERMSRDELRDSPPHILLTNFAMLEYLLLRPRDSALFVNQKLKYIVLDEAHSYTGAQGIEISMLMRRLNQYLEQKERKLQFVLTSATLGEGAEAVKKVASFACDLTGAEFTENDILQGETVNSFQEGLEESITLEELGKIIAGSGGVTAWTELLDDPEKLYEKLKSVNFINQKPINFTAPQILYNSILPQYAPLNKIHDFCRDTPLTVSDICEKLSVVNNNITETAITWLMAMGSHAKASADSSPLLPIRLHYFFRGLAGATICHNLDCPAKNNAGNLKWSNFILEDNNSCPACEKMVLPLSTCVHCGLPAHVLFLDQGKWQKSPNPIVKSADSRIVTWVDDFETEETQENDLGSESENQAMPKYAYLCVSCGGYFEKKPDAQCCDNAAILKFSLITKFISDGNLKKCPRCGGGAGAFDSVLRNFITFEDAPGAVIAETLIRNLPIDQDEEKIKLPANGRNLLVFSDSRQRAAFFAPYLAQTTAESVYLGPLEKAIEHAEKREGRSISFSEIAEDYVRGISGLPVIPIKQKENDEEYYELIPQARIRSQHKSIIKKEIELVLFRNFCASKKQRNTLESLGIASLRIDFNESELENIPRTLPELFQKSEEAGWQTIIVLVEVFLDKRAINFPDYITAKDITRFKLGPDAFTYNYALSGDVENRRRFRWNPYSTNARYKKNAVRLSRHLSILSKILKLDKNKDEEILSDLLKRIWATLTDESILVESGWPGEYRLDRECIHVTQQATWYICNKCSRITSLGSLGCCINGDCPGIPEPLDAGTMQERFTMDHYRQRYFLPPLPLEVKEHTAQLFNAYGREYQKQFIAGKVNVLSSSTTFEMGIDVGNLKAVFLRNVPPTTSSYIQRAGRAGRRKDGICAVVTFCRNIPHDQYNYNKPRSIILGNVPPPYINVSNIPLAQRHCNSFLLGFFLRDFLRSIRDPNLLKEGININDFFLSDSFGEKLVDRFVSWCGNSSASETFVDNLQMIIPKESELEAKNAISDSVERLATAGNSIKAIQVSAVLERFEEQIKELNKELTSADTRKKVVIARNLSSLEKLKEQFKKERLIDFLSSKSWLPGYAFPQDVVKLVVRHPEYSDRMRLERDREIGISEYAPGAQIIADGKVFTSGGVWYNSKEPEIRWYTRCPECRKIDTGLQTEMPRNDCSACGTLLTGINGPTKYLKPDAFTTLVDDRPQFPGLYRQRPPRTSEIFLLEGVQEQDFKEHPVMGISYGIKKDGKLFRANSNHNFKHFLICTRCGKNVESPAGKAHTTPWGSNCAGAIVQMDLAHEIVTDILQLRFQGCSAPPPDLTDKSFWHSLLAAFLNGASDALGIAANDLGGTFHGWTAESFTGELVIYDKIPGGAGHIQKIIDNMDTVLNEILIRVRDCKCSDISASCYACLRTYSNQFYWEQLSRKPVIDWLTAILGN